MTESKPLNIHQRIHAVMKEVTTIQKEDKKVNGQYTFVSHDEVTRVMHDAFVKHGIVMLPSVETVQQDGNRTEVMMHIVLSNIDEPKSDYVVVRYPGAGIDPQDKGIGKAISYAVKYALLKTFCLETSDDVEKHNIDYVQTKHISVKPKAVLKSPTPQQENHNTSVIDDKDGLKIKIKDIMRTDGGVLEASLKHHLNKTDPFLLTNDELNKVMKFIEGDVYKREVEQKRRG